MTLKIFCKELGNDDHHWIGWTARWILFYKSFGKTTKKVFTRSLRVLYVVYSPTKVVLTLIELHVLIDSLTVSPFFAAKTFYEEHINKVCGLIYIFRSANKITTLTTALIDSFRVWYVQCLTKRLTMNLIEFIHLKVWRSFSCSERFIEELDNNDIGPRVCKIQRLSFQNCLAVRKYNFRSRD